MARDWGPLGVMLGQVMGWGARAMVELQPHGFSWLVGAKVWLGWLMQVGAMWVLKAGIYSKYGMCIVMCIL